MSVPFPEAPPELIAPDIRQVIYSHLPTFEDARGACELFLNCSSYMCALQFYSAHYLCLPTMGAVQDLVLDEGRDITHSRNCVSKQVRANPSLFSRYASVVEVSCRRADPEPTTHHLSLLFIVLALSRLLYGEDNYTVESQDYFVLSRVALTLDSPVITTTVTAVQAIVSNLLVIIS